MRLVLFAGGFKPPHVGHFNIVKKLCAKYPKDKIYIISSSTPRLLVPPFDVKTYKLNKAQKEEIVSMKNKSSRCKKISDFKTLVKENCIPQITGEMSMKFWKEYRTLLDKKCDIHFLLSPMGSPIFFAYTIAQSLKPGDELVLVNSAKNHADARFNLFEGLKKKGIKVKDVEFNVYRGKSASIMREAIYNKDKKKFYSYLPAKLNDRQKEKLLRICNLKVV